jgi:hypothetical protein
VEDITPALAAMDLTPKHLQHGQELRKSSLDKPLPSLPPQGANTDAEKGVDFDQFLPGIPTSSTERGRSEKREDEDLSSTLDHPGEYLQIVPAQAPDKNLEHKLGVSNILDLSDTEDTTIHTTYAPAITHETIIENVHEVRHIELTREIHEHEYYHRILPIRDIEVLPARHFIPSPSGDGLREVPATHLPGRETEKTQRALEECFKQTPPKRDDEDGERRMFTAREFQDGEGKYKESWSENGRMKRTEQWWVHAPTIETRGREEGQTRPFYIGFPNLADNGLG